MGPRVPAGDPDLPRRTAQALSLRRASLSRCRPPARPSIASGHNPTASQTGGRPVAARSRSRRHSSSFVFVFSSRRACSLISLRIASSSFTNAEAAASLIRYRTRDIRSQALSCSGRKKRCRPVSRTRSSTVSHAAAALAGRCGPGRRRARCARPRARSSPRPPSAARCAAWRSFARSSCPPSQGAFRLAVPARIPPAQLDHRLPRGRAFAPPRSSSASAPGQAGVEPPGELGRLAFRADQRLVLLQHPGQAARASSSRPPLSWSRMRPSNAP